MTLRLRSGQGLLCAFVLLAAAPARAQIDVRPFALFAGEHFAASTTFNAVLASNSAFIAGGGVDVIIRRRFFVDLAISHWSKTGQRAFLNNGEVFRLGIPLGLTSTPVEVSAGYRFRLRKSRIIPYAGAGIGSYSFHQTSDFDTSGEDVDVRHAGFVATGGAEFRLLRWIALAGDAHYTRVPGILGEGGISKDAGEHNVGGMAGRLRIIITR